jgi:hypothetical protein
MMSEWAAAADYACRPIVEKEAVLGGPEQKTAAERMRFVNRLLPLERQRLTAMENVTAPRPPDVTRALDLVRESIQQLAAAKAAESRPAEFERTFKRWQNDVRSLFAIDDLGAHACAA